MRFTGTIADDSHLAGLAIIPAPVDPALMIAKVTRQIAALLATRFEATPHPVSGGFRKGMLRSLVRAGDSAIAVPVGLTGPPAGDITSLDHIILGGRDLAVGVALPAVLRLAEPVLQQIGNFRQTIGIHVSTPWPLPDIDTVYRVTVGTPTLTWKPFGTHAVLEIATSGAARTDSILPDATFDVTQQVVLNFDGTAGRLWLAEGARHVKVHASGVASGRLASEVQKGLATLLPTLVSGACAAAQPALDTFTNLTPLADQLRTLDAQASVAIDEAQFVAEGVVLRGRIGLSPRHAIVVASHLAPDGHAHTALESWMPGGRIDQFEWTWTGNPLSSTAGLSRSRLRDRFLLRPRARLFGGQWGLSGGGGATIPGIDGTGRLCLVVSGMQVDADTGAQVRVTSVRRCRRYGFSDIVELGVGRLRLPDLPDLVTDVPFPQLARRAATVGQAQGAGHVNTLLVFAGREWTEHQAATILGGLGACGRVDAGLVVLVLFAEGALGTPASPVMAEVHRALGRARVPVHVNEDVGGAWARAFEAPEAGVAFRMISPTGARPWQHDGDLEPDQLTAALDERLVATPPVAFAPSRLRYDVGDAIHVGRAFDTVIEARGPPLPFRRSLAETTVAFLEGRAPASAARLHALAATHADGHDGRRQLVIVIDGEDETLAREASAIGAHVRVVADPRGEVADRFGVRLWPTLLDLTPEGRISSLQLGLEPPLVMPVDPDAGDEGACDHEQAADAP